MAAEVLLLEDDKGLIEGLVYSLEKKGFEVQAAGSVREAKLLLREREYDLLLLDVTLPDGTGFDVCQMLRSTGNQVPIIFLTASDEEVNVIRGLDCGGDDYITKPFRLGELFSRIHALLRRAGIKNLEDTASLTYGDVTIDLAGSRAWLSGQKLELTSAEYRLLCLLVRAGGRTVTREMILDELWDNQGRFVEGNTLSVYIRRLREKVEENPSEPKHLLTVRGFGYCWKRGNEEEA